MMRNLGESLRGRFEKSIHPKKIWWIAAAGAALGLSAAPFLLPGGGDLYRFYRTFTQGWLDCGYAPYFAQWFLWPLKFFS
jgi:hypothetical protein